MFAVYCMKGEGEMPLATLATGNESRSLITDLCEPPEAVRTLAPQVSYIGAMHLPYCLGPGQRPTPQF